MTATRRYFIFAVLFLLPVVATAATTEFRVLIDSDNNAATGCATGGMTGIDHVLVTRVQTDATSGAVDQSYRLTCSGGSTFSAPIDMTAGGWSVGFNPANGGMLVENRLAFSVLTNAAMPTNMRLGFLATTSGASHGATAHTNGSPVIYPVTNGRRHSVGAPGNPRVFQLDGNGNDWNGLNPLVNGIASGGSPAIRMIQVYAFANPHDSFIYFRFDAHVGSDAPFAEDDEYERPAGQDLTVPAPGVLANDGDPNGQPLTALPVSDAAHGDVTLNADGSFTYQPNNPASSQTDSFQYKASNGTQESNVAKVTITVSAVVDTTPVASDDSYPGTEDTPLSVPAPGVLANDSDADGDDITATKLTDPSNGTVVVNDNGSFTYTPNQNFFGTDTFTYTVSDGTNTATATVTITVESINDAPVLNDAAFSVNENSANGTAVGTVTATDVEGDSVTYAITGGNTNGAFAIDNSGNIIVANQSALDFESTPSFSLTITVTDSGVPGQADTATVTITINDVNEAPLALDDATSIVEDGSVNVVAPGLLANDSDPDGDSITASKVSDPANGVATVAANGGWTYTPNANFNGTDSFTYRVNDGSLDSNVATVTIVVTAVNDPPSFTSGGNVNGDEDTPFSAPWATAISAGPADEAGQTLTFNVTNDNNAMFSVQPAISSTGVLTFTPALNVTGPVNVSVTLSDNGGGTNTSGMQNFVITIREANDLPVATNDARTTPEDTALVFAAATLTGNDAAGPANESGQTLTVTGVSATSAQGGTVVLAAGNITYTPPANYNGPDSFTYTVTDNGTTAGAADPQSANGTVNVTVTEVNDAPAANADAANASEDTPLIFAAATLTTNDSAGPANESAQTLTVTGVSATSAQGGTVTLSAGNITYTPPVNYFGADSFTYTVSDNGTTNGAADPLTANGTVNVTVAAVNDVPVLTVTGAVTHTEAGAATNLATAANIVDLDDTNIEGATIAITGNYAGAEDVLSFVNTPNITGNVVGNTLTLTGTDTEAAYIAALQAVQYTNTSDVPSTLQRSITWTVNDGDGNSNAQVTTLNVVASNDAPVNAVPGGQTVAEDTPLTFSTANGNAISISDIDAAADDVQVTLNVTNGTVTLNGAATGALTSLTGNGTGTVVATGTVAEINAALDGMTFAAIANYNGAAAIQVVTDDLGNNPSGALTDTDSVSITVTAVNDASVLTVTGAVTHTEGGAATNLATAANITDLDDTNIESATIQITGNYAGAEDVLSFVNTPNITGNVVGNTLTLTGSDTIANYIAALQAVQYTNTSDVPSTLQRTITWTVNDGDNVSNSQTTTLDVTATNDAPVNAIPAAAQSTNEDTPLTLSGANALAISDADAASDDVQVTLNVTNGTVALDPTATGALTSLTGDGTATVVATGTVAEINAALDGMTFTPTADSNLMGTIQIVTDDLGNNPSGALTDTDSLNITVNAVNDVPVLSVTGAVTHTEAGVATQIATAASINDLDDTNIESATIVISANFATGDTLAFVNTPNITGAFVGSTLTLTGTDTEANYAAALQAITFSTTSDTPSTLQRTITWTVNDGDGNSNSQTTTVDVTAINDAPVNAMPGAQSTNEDTPLTMSGANAISISDVDAASDDVQVTLNVTNGTVALDPTATGALTALTGDGTATVVATGTVAEINAALDGMVFTPTADSNAMGTIQIVTDDLGNNPSGALTDIDSVNITVNAVNDVPVLTVTGAVTHTEAGAATTVATAANITDLDDTNIEGATITITGNYAGAEDVLSFVNTPNITGNVVGSTLTLTGTDTEANYAAALQTVQYTNTSDAPSTLQRTISWTVTDGDGNSNTQTTTLDVTATNDAPVNAIPGGAQSTTEDTPLTLSGVNAISISDADAASDDVQVTLNVTNGTVALDPTATGALTSLTGDGTATVVATGTVAEINAALDGMTFTPTLDSNAMGTIQIVTDDLGNNPSGALTDTDSLNITVNAANDAPVLTVTGTPTFAENGPAVAIAATVNITDVDDTNIESATITITNVQSGDVLNFINTANITGNFAAGVLTLTGSDTEAAYIAALQSITFSNASDNPSTTQRAITWTVNDGDTNSNVQNTTLDVTATNDAPANTVAVGVATNEDTPVVINGASIADPDADPDDVQVTLNVTSGTVALDPTATGALASLTGDGTATVVATGTVAEINAALSGMTFTPALDFSGTASIQMVVDDLGNNPSGALTDTDSFNITVNNVNDAPVLTVTGTPTFAENGSAVAIAATVTITDIDDTNIESATITIINVQSGDVLNFINTANITGNYAAGVLTLTGSDTEAAYDTALESITFSNASDNPSIVQRTITWVVNDGTIDSNTQNTTLDVTATNDAPVNTVAVGVTTNEDTPVVINGASIADADADPDDVQITLNVTGGTVTLDPTATGALASLTGDGTATVVATGTVAEINAALSGMTFTPTLNFNGTASIQMVTDDLGNNPSGALSDTDSFNITVNAVNDAPSFTPGADVAINEDHGPYSESAWATSISAGPADESGQGLSMNSTVTGTTGTLTFMTAPAVNVVTGNLTFQANANTCGTATVDITLTDDAGTVGVPGDDLSSPTHTLNIIIQCVNDAPSFTKGADQTVDEDAGAQTVNPWATAISPGPGETDAVTFNVSNNNNALFTAGGQPAVSPAGVLTYTPAPNANGTTIVSVTLTDDAGTPGVPGDDITTAAQTFNITVTAVNDAPSFTLPGDPAFVVLGAGAQTVGGYATSINDGDPELTQVLTFNISQTGNTGTLGFDAGPAIDPATGNLTYTPTPGTHGTVTFSVTLSDNGSNTAPNVNISGAQSFTIAVEKAPEVVPPTVPADNATGVSTSTNITVNFDEPVSVTLVPATFKINCNAGPDLGFAYVGGTTNVTTVTLDPTNPLPAGNCVVTVVAAEVHDTDAYDPPDGLAVDYVFDFVTNTPPTAVDDNTTALGHVTLTVADADGVLVNGTDGAGADTDPDAGAVLTIQNPGTPIATTQGGTITFTAGGGYTYHSQAMDQNITDTVNYTVTDQFGGTDVGQLSINLGPRFIYVDDNHPTVTPDGRDFHPWKTMQQAQANSAAGDTILVMAGNYNDHIVLQANQRLIGQGISANHVVTHNTVNFTVLTMGASPSIARAAAGDTITLGASNIVRGVTIGAAAGRGVVGNAFTAVTITEALISTTGGAALDLTTGTATIALASTTSANSTGTGVNLVGINGTVDLGTGAITNPTGIGFNASCGQAAITYAGNVSAGGAGAVVIASRPAGSSNVSLSGTITGSANGIGINVNNVAAGIVTFSGAKNLTTAANAGVSLATNTNGTVVFSGGALVINTTTGTGFTATGGGTVTVLGAANTINTTGAAAAALNLNGVTMAAGNGVTFNSVAAGATTVTGVSLTGLLGTGGVTINGGTNSALTGLSMTTMGTVPTALNNVTLNNATDSINGTNFGTLTVSNVAVTATLHAFVLNTGNLNGTFTSVNCTPAGNNVPVTLTTVGGSFTVSGGAIGSGGGGSTPDVFVVTGGNVAFTWNGTMNQAKAGALINITNHSTGLMTFGSTLTANTGSGLQFTNADGNYQFTGAATLSGTAGIDVLAGVDATNGSQGTFNWDADSSIAATTDQIIDIQGSKPTFTYSGTFTKNNTGNGINALNNQGGSITLNGTTKTITTTNAGAHAINLDNNDNCVIAISGNNLLLTTTTGDGLRAINGGTITLTGTGNIATAVGGAAVNIANTFIGLSGVTFRTVNANGGANGIIVNTVGTTSGTHGGFSITGNGGAGTGGTIQNTGVGITIASSRDLSLNWLTFTNANTTDGGGAGLCDSGTVTGCNGAVKMTTVTNATLTQMTMTGTMADNGIFGNGVRNLDISNVTITNAGDAVNEHGIRVSDLFGTTAASQNSIWTNIAITNAAGHNIFVQTNSATNAFPGAADELTITNSTFTNPGSAGQSDQITIAGRNAANIKNTLSNNTFNSTRVCTDAMQVDAGNTSHSDVIMTGNTFNVAYTVGTTVVQGCNTAMNVSGANTSVTTFSITNNPVVMAGVGTAINIASNGSSTLTGTISGHTNITVPAGLKDGTSNATNLENNGMGIDMVVDQQGTITALVDGNTVNDLSTGVRGTARNSGTGRLNLTLSNNTFDSGGIFELYPVYLASGNGSGSETNEVCVNFNNNQTVTGIPGNSHYWLEQWGGVGSSNKFNIQGLTPTTGATEAQIEAYVSSKDIGGATVEVNTTGVIAYTGTGVCSTP